MSKVTLFGTTCAADNLKSIDVQYSGTFPGWVWVSANFGDYSAQSIRVKEQTLREFAEALLNHFNTQAKLRDSEISRVEVQ